MDFEEAIRMAGYNTIDDYFKRLVLPVLAITLLLFFSTLILINLYGGAFDIGIPPILLLIVPFTIMILGIVFMVFYPFYIVERIRVNIHENIHYFITFVGALATMHIRRRPLFRYASQRVEYGEIAKIMEKVSYLSDYWNLGLVRTCRKLATLVPSKVLGNFLDRMSAAFDFGERLEVFLQQEQEAVMEDFATEYKQSLQTLSLVQDALVSLTIAVSFMMAISFMLPLIMGYSIYMLVALSALAFFLIDVLSLVFIDTFITHDPLCHALPIKAPEYLKLKTFVLPVLGVSAFLLIILLVLRPVSATAFLIAFALTPLAVIGFFGSQLESAILSKDQAFPAFIRSLGGSMSARGGSLAGTLGPLMVHEFGVLNDPVKRLNSRLKIRCDKFQSWMYFAGETGSNLIEKFGSIFIQVINLGGEPESASELISRNFIKLLSLRELRLQLASSVKGVYYGTLIGIAGAAYATLRMVRLLDNTFKRSFAAIAQTPSVSALTQGLLPSIGDINFPLVEDLIFVVLVIHAGFSAYSIKMVDGGTKYAAFLDFIIMVWFITIIALGVPFLFEFLFSSGEATSGMVQGMSPIP